MKRAQRAEVTRDARPGIDAGAPDAALYYAIQLFQLRYEQGRAAEAEDVLTHTISGAPELPALRAALAVLRVEAGRDGAAREVFDELAGPGFDQLAVEASTMVTYCFGATVGAALRDLERCAQLHRLLAPYPEQLAVWAVGLGVGSVAQHRGRLCATLGDLDQARERFETALRIEERVGGRPWLARTRVEYARALLARGRPGDRSHSRDLLTAARSEAHRLGMAGVERTAATWPGAPDT